MMPTSPVFEGESGQISNLVILRPVVNLPSSMIRRLVSPTVIRPRWVSNCLISSSPLSSCEFQLRFLLTAAQEFCMSFLLPPGTSNSFRPGRKISCIFLVLSLRTELEILREAMVCRSLLAFWLLLLHCRGLRDCWHHHPPSNKGHVFFQTHCDISHDTTPRVPLTLPSGPLTMLLDF